MPAAHVLVRVNGQRTAAYFTLERSISTKEGVRKEWIGYLGKFPRVPNELEKKYSIHNPYRWLLSKPQHVLDKFLRDYLERRQRMRGDHA